jgi:hypothetical protein
MRSIIGGQEARPAQLTHTKTLAMARAIVRLAEEQ